MIFLAGFYVLTNRISSWNIIKASAIKRRLGVRVASRGFYRDVRGEALSRTKWGAAGVAT